MKKINGVDVEEVSQLPDIGKPDMMGGIRTAEAAANWAAKRGYTKVFWFKSRERVYADKLSHPSQQTQLVLSEAGGTRRENAATLGLAALLILLIGLAMRWPW